MKTHNLFIALLFASIIVLSPRNAHGYSHFEYSPEADTAEIDNCGDEYSYNLVATFVAHGGNGDLTESLKIAGGGHMMDSWFTVDRPLVFHTGTGSSSHNDTITCTITITVPCGTPDGTYKCRLKLEPSAPGESNGIALTIPYVGYPGNDCTTPIITSDPANVTVCDGSTASFSVSGSDYTSVQWQLSTDGGTNFADIAGATSTTYSFTASMGDNGNEYLAKFTDSCGTGTTTFSYSLPATLTVNPLPTSVITGSPAICYGTSTNLSVTLTGTSPWSITWSDGITETGVTDNPHIRSVSPETTMTYTITALSDGNGCNATSMTGSTTVTVNPLPTSVLTGTATICYGTSTNLSVALTGTSPWSMTWSDGITETGVTDNPHIRSVSPGSTTTYTITALSDDNGCNATSMTGSATVTVNPLPTSVLTGTATICYGTSMNLSVALTGTSPWSMTWSDGITETGVTDNPHIRSVSPGSTTTYTITALSDGNGCNATSMTGSATVTVNPLPTAVITGDTVILNTQSAIITVSGFGGTAGPGNVTWCDGQTVYGVTGTVTHTFAPSTTIECTATITDAVTGCSALASGVATIIVLPSANLDIYSSENLTSGRGKTAATTKLAFKLLKFGIYSQAQVSAAAKTYTATLGSGPKANPAGQVLWQLVIPASGKLSDATTVTFGGSPAYHYRVLVPADTGLVLIGNGTDLSKCAHGTIINGGPVSGVRANTIGTKYILVVVSTDSCKSDPYTGKDVDLATEIPSEYTLEQNYPNPFSTESNISFAIPVDDHVTLRIYSITGALLQTLVDANVAAGSYNVAFDASNLVAGTYIYQLRSGNHLLTKRMTIIK